MNIKGKKRSSLEKSHAHPLDLVLNSLLTFTYTFDKVHKVQKYFKGKCSPGVSYRRMLLIVINRISIAPPLSTVLSGISKKLQESNLAHHLLSRLNFQIQKNKHVHAIVTSYDSFDKLFKKKKKDVIISCTFFSADMAIYFIKMAEIT